MEQLNQQEEILALGKRIIKEFSSNDEEKITLLEKWMGHYIAELIYKIETTIDVAEKEKLQKECFETILKLWEKRSLLPSEVLPLSQVKQAINILNELKREKSLWERIQNPPIDSWESLAVKIHENYTESLNICIQASLVDDAIGWEKAWINDANQFLSDDEKELINRLESFLEDNSTSISFTIEEDKPTTDVSKKRIDRVFDRLESITDEQKQTIKTFREKSC